MGRCWVASRIRSTPLESRRSPFWRALSEATSRIRRRPGFPSIKCQLYSGADAAARGGTASACTSDIRMNLRAGGPSGSVSRVSRKEDALLTGKIAEKLTHQISNGLTELIFHLKSSMDKFNSGEVP